MLLNIRVDRLNCERLVMKAGFFTDRFSQFAPFEIKRRLVGWNTGNMIFRDAIQKMILCDVVVPHEPFDRTSFGAFITTELIWLQEGMEPWRELYDQLSLSGDKPLIPISIGLQTFERKMDFQLNPKMIDYMKALQERVKLAVRGEYTAEILSKYGIANTEVIGCPSIYQLPLYNSSLDGLVANQSKRLSATANFRTFIGDLNDQEKKFLSYVMEHFDGFAEQTFEPLSKVEGVDGNLIEWMNANSYCFFDLDTWRRYNARYDFSMGMRFHGNVAALLANIPALFLVIDSRTSEMTEFLRLPALRLSDFDSGKALQFYYEMADYGNFVDGYLAQISRFTKYVAECGLYLSEEYRAALEKFRPLD